MTRAQQTISLAMLLTSIYLAVYMEVVSFPAKIQNEIVPYVCTSSSTTMESQILTPGQLPFWALISFGSYLLFKLGWGVFTFNDVPEAHKELMAEIGQARKELKAKGVDVGED
ncbi:dolichol phosphate mannosyltransferas-like protein subunit 3 [Pyrenochaeta sp. DS3sAY3a]|nr:dolichol phosphate mannosyltransferas-like protein subunit 3 [Pyrenochaeta sp. DS3sAY3a]